ncbi:MAG TPA: hypothetical protein H9788_00080 [Candidatus Brevibacterium intestinavium]|nr:hypothetical protein [Candidatus Brevibacterium intestinavium]
MKSMNIGSKESWLLAAVSGAVLTLSACGGGVSGEFFNGDGLLVIDDGAAVFTDFTCSESGKGAELEPEHQFHGELTEDGEQVMWDLENQSAYSWTPEPAEPIIENQSGDQITIGDQQFKKMSEDEALEEYSRAEC